MMGFDEMRRQKALRDPKVMIPVVSSVARLMDIKGEGESDGELSRSVNRRLSPRLDVNICANA